MTECCSTCCDCDCKRSWLSPATIGMEAMIPAAIVIDTVADPTDTRTATATRNAIRTIGSGSAPTKFPNTSPIPEF